MKKKMSNYVLFLTLFCMSTLQLSCKNDEQQSLRSMVTYCFLNREEINPLNFPLYGNTKQTVSSNSAYVKSDLFTKDGFILMHTTTSRANGKITLHYSTKTNLHEESGGTAIQYQNYDGLQCEVASTVDDNLSLLSYGKKNVVYFDNNNMPPQIKYDDDRMKTEFKQYNDTSIIIESTIRGKRDSVDVVDSFLKEYSIQKRGESNYLLLKEYRNGDLEAISNTKINRNTSLVSARTIRIYSKQNPIAFDSTYYNYLSFDEKGNWSLLVMNSHIVEKDKDSIADKVSNFTDTIRREIWYY